MKRRSFLTGIGVLPLIVVAPSLAFQKVLPRDIPVPKTAKELGDAIDRLFTRYSPDSIQKYEDVGDKRYEHVLYQLASPALDMEDKLAYSLWMTACMQREKCTASSPMVLWRRRPVYQEDASGFEYEEATSVDSIKSKITARWSIVDGVTT